MALRGWIVIYTLIEGLLSSGEQAGAYSGMEVAAGLSTHKIRFSDRKDDFCDSVEYSDAIAFTHSS